jgi:hypothetical protein
MNKYIKTIIIINGLLIPVVVIYLIIINFNKDSGLDSYSEDNDAVIVGEKLDKAKNDSMALQGINYESPEQVYNSTNYYLPISVMTYEQAKDYKAMRDKAGDISPSFSNYYNVLFLDKDYNVIAKLLDKKASITEIRINRGGYNHNDTEIDKTVKNIAYLISFTDSNNDGYLDWKDNHDLYISDLNGLNLMQVTKNLEIIDFNFINANTEIFVKYKERSTIREEYKRNKFGVFKINTAKWIVLKDLDSKLDEIEKSLIK